MVYETKYATPAQKRPEKNPRQPEFNFKFGGQTYDKDLDQVRLTGQFLRIYALMKDGKWRSLREVEKITKDPQASISARLRDTRKVAFGSHTMERRRRGERLRGLHEYRLIVNPHTKIIEVWDDIEKD